MMEELEKTLREQGKRYPQMECTDAVKLIYQNEFGGGHLIRDEAACLSYLRREYEAVEKDGKAQPFEPIGNGIIRVNLAALEEEKLEQLGLAFIRSAAEHKGSMESFLGKLTVLKKLAGEGIFSFGTEELEAYLADYQKAGYPPVSHSQAYRDAYKPAYRVVMSDKWLLQGLLPRL